MGKSGNYDGTGALSQYRVIAKSGNTTYTNTYESQYVYIGSGPKEVIQTATTSAANYKKGVTLTNYDVHGNIQQITDQDGGADTRDFIVKPDGTILLKKVDYDSQTDGSERDQYYYANDQLVGSKGATVDFDLNYTPVSETYPASSPGNYVARTGETVQDIARAFYGDASLWYLIADANGLANNTSVIAGQTLVITNRITNIRNASDTFTPFNTGKAIGDSTPTLEFVPPPPPRPSRKHCVKFLTVVVIVIAVVATIYTAGAATAILPSASGFLSTVAVGAAAGAAGAAAGSAAGQLAANLFDLQDGFSFSAVGRAAVGGAITGGIAGGLNFATTALDLTGTATNVARAALGNALDQGINLALHRQDNFNWTAVAAASATATVVSSRTGERTRDSVAGGSNGFFNDLEDTATGQLVNRGVTIALQGHGGFDVVTIAADAFGNAIGNAIARQAWRTPTERERQQQARDIAEQRVQIAEEEANGAGVGDATSGVGVGRSAGQNGRPSRVSLSQAEYDELVHSGRLGTPDYAVARLEQLGITAEAGPGGGIQTFTYRDLRDGIGAPTPIAPPPAIDTYPNAFSSFGSNFVTGLNNFFDRSRGYVSDQLTAFHDGGFYATTPGLAAEGIALFGLNEAETLRSATIRRSTMLKGRCHRLGTPMPTSTGSATTAAREL